MAVMRRVPLAIDVDFAPRRPSRAGWVILAAGVLLLGGAVFTVNTAREDVAQRRAIVEGLRSQIGAAVGRTTGGVKGAPKESELRPAREIASALGAAWGQVFQAIADAQTKGVSWLGLDVEGGRGELRLTGEAQSHAAVFALLERLEAAEIIEEARLASVERSAGSGRDVLRFTAVARWRR